MKVSLIIAAYNIQDYIERCIKSILNQTYKNIEIIVVNDGSTDNTLEIIDKACNNDSRVKVFNQENRGLIEARKSGLNLAQGEYVLFVDGDDYIELNCVEILYNKAIKENSDIVLFNAYYSYDDRREAKYTFDLNNIIENDKIKSLFLGSIQPSIWSKFIRYEYIVNNDIIFPSDITFAEDLATTSSLFMYNPKISYEDSFLYNYYQRSESVTKKINSKILESDLAIKFIKEQLLKNNIYEIYKDEFEMLSYLHLFIYRFMYNVDYSNICKQMYEKYKEHNININSNSYIKKYIKNTPIKIKLGILAYKINYFLGITFIKSVRSIKQ